MDNEVNKQTSIDLKRINGIENLDAERLKKALIEFYDWIDNFKKKSEGDKKVSGDFAVEGFNYGGVFDLSTADDILKGIVPSTGKVPYLFISDILNFIEQIRTSLDNKKFAINIQQREELSRLNNSFRLLGVTPSNRKIKIEDLQRMEDAVVRGEDKGLLLKQILDIYKILKPSIDPEPETEEEAAEDDNQDDEQKEVELKFEQLIENDNQETEEEEKEAGSDEEEPDEQKNKDLKEPPQPIKISELEPESRLYLQSLSIITINQALTRYFNAKSLEQLGLPPNTRITFDQLPLEIRQQLMDRAFAQVENLLLEGKYSVADLIKNPSQRIAFSSETALSLLIDLRGLNLLNQAVREIAQAQNKQEKITQNEEKELRDQDLNQRIKGEKENVLNSKEAEEIFEKSNSSENIDGIIRGLESQINVFSDAGQLDQELIRQLGEILNNREPTKITEATYNIIPFIDLFIQQGLPPEYVIPDPKNFDYNRFINIFGKTIDESEFNQHREELANLIIFYWKRKRAIWARDIRQEFGIEKYSPEQAQRLFEQIQKHPEFGQRIRELALIDRNYDSTAIASAYANGQQTGIKEFDEFQQYQKDLINKFLQEHLAKLDKENQQQTLKAYFEYYQPGVEYETYNIEIFNQQIVPQISPMDFYLLQAAESFGYSDEFGPSFTTDGNGYVQQAFLNNKNTGSSFVNSTLGQAAIGLASEAIGDALYAIPGFGEALMAAEAAAPILKKIKNEAIGKALQWVAEHWKELALLAFLLTLLSFLISFLPALLLLGGTYLLLRNGLPGLQRLLSGTQSILRHTSEGIGINNAGTISKTALSKTQAVNPAAGSSAKLALGKLTPAMIVAGQAVVTTVAATSFLAYIYRENLNSAFLTNFPTSESEYLNSVEKTSKYAKISKKAKIIKGCSNPENDGAKCENPSFPLSIEYTVTIEPKEDFSIQITNINDELKFKQSGKGWEEAGQSAPTISSGRTLGFDYFKELISEQGGMSSGNLQDSGSNSDTTIDPTTVDTGEDQENIIILPGQKLTFTYTLDDLESIYNHTAIINTIEADFYYQNSFMSGNDNIITAARVCLGNCSAGAGCWPATGNISQLPYGDFSHSKPNGLSYIDAYDIACSGCSSAALYGPSVFAPFDGELCYMGCAESEGCYYVLTFSNGGESQKVNFLHFWEPNADFSAPNTCIQVEAGYLIGPMGTNGFSTGVHLHYGASHGGAFYFQSNPGEAIIEELTPEDDQGNQPALLNNTVTTCYE